MSDPIPSYPGNDEIYTANGVEYIEIYTPETKETDDEDD